MGFWTGVGWIKSRSRSGGHENDASRLVTAAEKKEGRATARVFFEGETANRRSRDGAWVRRSTILGAFSQAIGQSNPSIESNDAAVERYYKS